MILARVSLKLGAMKRLAVAAFVLALLNASMPGAFARPASSRTAGKATAFAAARADAAPLTLHRRGHGRRWRNPSHRHPRSVLLSARPSPRADTIVHRLGEKPPRLALASAPAPYHPPA